jgi:hypothetical protein
MFLRFNYHTSFNDPKLSAGSVQAHHNVPVPCYGQHLQEIMKCEVLVASNAIMLKPSTEKMSPGSKV